MKAMRNIFIILVSVFVLMSCEYLDTRPIQDLSNDELWSHSSYGEGLLSRAYANLSTTWDVQSEYYTENAVPNAPGANLLALGGWTLEGNPIGSWDSWYTSIRYLNEFIENGGDLLYSVTDLRKDSILRSNRMGEAYFLRAYYQWMLLKTYGGFVEGDPEAKGFVIVTEILGPGDELNLPRNSYEDCVAQIAADCDEAIARLPLRYNDGTDPYTGHSNRGRGDRLKCNDTESICLPLGCKSRLRTINIRIVGQGCKVSLCCYCCCRGVVCLAQKSEFDPLPRTGTDVHRTWTLSLLPRGNFKCT